MEANELLEKLGVGCCQKQGNRCAPVVPKKHYVLKVQDLNYLERDIGWPAFSHNLFASGRPRFTF